MADGLIGSQYDHYLCKWDSHKSINICLFICQT